MATTAIHPYVFEVLMPDLVGHDRKPSAFVVYLYLSHRAQQLGRNRVPASLQTIAVKTGLSKSSVQTALRHLQRRGLVSEEPTAAADPCRVVLRPWLRRAGE